MLPSTWRRGPAGPRRALVYAFALLLGGVALLAPTHSPLMPSEVVTPVTNGAGAGGPLLARAHGVVYAADPDGAADTQATANLPAAVQVTAAATFYDVEGTDVRSLLASLRQRGPSDGQGTWAASTSWVFRWSYQPVLESGCSVQAAHVNLELAYTYPRWSTAASAAPAAANAWQGYLARVELHEHGHRDIAETAANDLARAIEALPAQSSCDALAEAARATATDLLARHAQAQAAYDRETGHGATQGAVLHE